MNHYGVRVALSHMLMVGNMSKLLILSFLLALSFAQDNTTYCDCRDACEGLSAYIECGDHDNCIMGNLMIRSCSDKRDTIGCFCDFNCIKKRDCCFNYFDMCLFPRITSITPSTDVTQGGSPLNIYGERFEQDQGDGYVMVGSNNCPITQWGNSLIVCVLPSGTGTRQPVRVYTTVNVSNSIFFDYLPPVIESIVPSIGDTIGYQDIIINGLNFGNIFEEIKVEFDGIETIVSDYGHTQLTIQSVPGEGINKVISVNISNQLTNIMWDYDKPSIQEVFPDHGPTDGFLLTIFGKNFGYTASATVADTECDYVSQNHTYFKCWVPSGQGSTQQVRVYVANQQSNFLYLNYDPPVIENIFPLSADTDSETILTIKGYNFGPDHNGVIHFGASTCDSSLYHYNDTHITCRIPPLEGVNIQIYIDVSTQYSESVTFSFNPPELDDVFPPLGHTIGGTTLQLSGNNFGLSSSVKVGGIQCPVTYRDHHNINCTLPSGQGGDIGVVVAVLNRNTDPFTIGYYPPSINDIIPNNSSTEGGSTVTIIGQDFGEEGTVFIGGAECVSTSIGFSHQSIHCILPSGEGTDKEVEVVVSSQDDSKTGIFSYSPPSITSSCNPLCPASGTTGGITLLTITGTSFGYSGDVFIDEDICSVQSRTHTQIICSSPSHSGGNADIYLWTANQISNILSPGFTYLPPTINSLSPQNGFTLGGTLLVINGESFDSYGKVDINGIDCEILSWEHGQIMINSPPGEGKNLDITVTTNVSLFDTKVGIFSYNIPQIFSLECNDWGTIGGETLTVHGSNFGLNPDIWIDNLGAGFSLCLTSGSQDQVWCPLPTGNGLQRAVEIRVAGQYSNTKYYDYTKPDITKMYPISGPTVGLNILTLTGSDFGPNINDAKVTIGDVDCSPISFFNHTTIHCLVPPGQGSNLPVIVEINQQSSWTTLYYSYSGPIIDYVNPSIIPTLGGVPITITGSSLGLSGTATVNERDCQITSHQDDEVICTAPAGEGDSLIVRMFVSSQPSNPGTISYERASIDYIEPSIGPTIGAIPITVYGDNFGESGEVFFDTIPCDEPYIRSHSSIVCSLPSGLGSDIYVSVFVLARISINGTYFDYLPPNVTHITPDIIPTSGGIITIYGENFGDSNSLSTVIIGDSTCTPVDAGFEHIMIVCNAPSGSGSDVNVNVTIAGQISVDPFFIDYDAPNITYIYPTSGPTSGSVSLTVNGYNLGSSLTGNVFVAEEICDITYHSHTKIICKLPVGTGDVDVFASIGSQPSNVKTFSYSSPSISTISPSLGPTIGSIPLTIYGSSFDTGGTVLVGGKVCTLISWYHSEVVCSLPSNIGKDHLVVLTTVSSKFSSDNIYFHYIPPSISSITPNIPVETIGGDMITLEGSNFGIDDFILPDGITIAGRYCSSESNHQHNSIECVVPEGQGKNQPVQIIVGGQSSNILPTFSYLVPILDSIDPLTCSTEGCPFNLLGHNFGLTPSVSIGGIQALSINNDHNNITCIVPEGQGRDKLVQVKVDSQYSNKIPFHFQPPHIDYIYPLNGPTYGNITLTINGHNFGTFGQVLVGSNTCPITFHNHTLIECDLPSSEGDANIIVTISSQTSNLSPFSYNAPVISEIKPYASGSTNGGDKITIIGTNFGTSGYVTIDGLICTTIGAITHNEIQCNVPSGEGVNLDLIVIVGNLMSTPKKFNYEAPLLLNIYPTFGETSGEYVLTLIGESFGSSGTVMIGTFPCNPIVSGYDHQQILCTVPPGQGEKLPVVVTTFSQSSNFVNFSYINPSISSLTVTNGPTSGINTYTVIIGSNFGVSGTALIGGNECVPIFSGWDHTRIECVIPPGRGKDNNVIVISGGVSSPEIIFFDYDAPIISSVSPSLVPVLGSQLTIFGENFGGDAMNGGCTDIDIPPVFSIVDCNHTVMIVDLAAGCGHSHLISFMVKSLPSTGDITYSYIAPTITQVKGCNDFLMETLSCSIDGEFITIIGSNFCLDKELDIVIIDNTLNCNVTSVTSSSELLCTLPANIYGGFNLDVVLTADDQSSDPVPLLSYEGPIIYGETLIFTNSPETKGDIVFYGDTQISFEGEGFGDDEAVITVFFGPLYDLNLYSCSNVILNYTHQILNCDVPTNAVGVDMYFSATVGFRTSTRSLDSIGFPLPSIVNDSLRSALNDPGNDVFTSIFTEGEYIYFDVIGAGTLASEIVVKYGPPGVDFEDKPYFCSYVTLENSYNTIRCLTQPGEGSHVFQLKVVGALSSEGHDEYNYPLSPIVDSISGCPNNLYPYTSDCPTEGEVTLTITGNNFPSVYSSVLVKIGIGNCVVTNLVSVNEIQCILPAGVGFNRQVTVISGQRFSRSKDYLSYSTPLLTEVHGCLQNNYPNTAECDRVGEQLVTLTGSNFGEIEPIILVGGVQASSVNIITPHTEITFMTPPGTELNRALIMIQNGGVLSANSLLLSYELCPPGTYSEIGVLTCAECPAGSFSSQFGSKYCSECESGFYSDIGAIFCTKCSAGNYSVRIDGHGPTSCLPCEPGYYSTLEASTECTPCSPGYKSPEESQQICTKCIAGSYSNAQASQNCNNCTLGTYSPVDGAIVCTICEAGTFSSVIGATSCESCSRGTYQPNAGRSTCIDCNFGFASSVIGSQICTACEPGSFSNSTGLENCYKCQPGYYSVKTGGIGATMCTMCPAGSYSDIEGASSCMPCPQGYFSNIGESSCTRCLAGTYSGAIGQSECYECERGYYASFLGSIQCLPCNEGKYANDTGMPNCLPCPGGTYQPLSGASTCLECYPGSAAPALTDGQTYCPDCLSGYYSNSSGWDHCLICDVGTFSIGSSTGPTECTPCPAGTASNLQGQESCSICQPGTITPIAGLTTCSQCPKGTYVNEISGTICKNCQTGQYAPTQGSLQCLFCPSGTFSNDIGSSNCTLCAAGTSQSEIGSSTCNECGSGYFSSVEGATQCIICPTGTYSDSFSNECTQCEFGYYQNLEGGSSCIKCPLGSYSSSLGSEVCTLCPSGEFSSIEGGISCSKCLAGTYSPNPGSAGCLPCPEGTISQDGQFECVACPIGTFCVSPQLCQQCIPGEYQDLTGQSSCKSCPIGSSSNSYGSVQCILCELGTYADVAGLSQCISCDPGQYTDIPGSSLCKDCASGTYSFESGSDICALCPIGTISSEGASLCSDCPPGQFQPILGGISCTSCAFGSANSLYGQASCSQCASGTYADLEGLFNCFPCDLGSYSQFIGVGPTNCTLCPEGTFTNSLGSPICSPCKIGYHQPQIGQDSCIACDSGFYSDTSGSINCSPCSLGLFSIGTGNSFCQECEAGSFSNVLGSTNCTRCPPGTHQDLSGQTSCDECIPGEYSSISGSIFCSDCSIGTFSNQYRSTNCTSCTPGTFQNFVSASACIDCPVGTFSSSSGSIVCQNCPQGTFQDLSRQASCIKCSEGYYENNIRSIGCRKCSVGTFSPSVGTVLCSECLPGTFTDSEGMSSCTPCDRGYYQSQSGSDKCEPCLQGRYSNIIGAQTCLDCLKGTYTDSMNSSTCISCPPGSTTLGSASLSCIDCPIGTYANSYGSISCQPCGIGKYSDEVGTSICKLCPPSTYQDSFGQSSCISCPLGYANSVFGQAFCFKCEPGYYASSEGQKVCNRCSAGFFSESGSIICDPCSIGSYSIAEGQSSCLLSPVGTYVDEINSTQPTLCPPGNYADNVGLSSCKKCGLGTYASQHGTYTCSVCQEGTFASAEGLTECIPCYPGFYQDYPSQTLCKPCDIGTYNPFVGKYQCLPCQSGHYRNVNDTDPTQCELCPAGSFQLDHGQIDCELCHAGTYQDEMGNPECKNCEAGTYVDFEGALECIECLPGTTQTQSGQQYCTNCTAGTYSGSGQPVCASCPPGTYQDEEGATDCKDCMSGYYMDSPGSISCLKCNRGYYSGTGASICTPCDPGTYNNITGGDWTSCIKCPPLTYQPNLGGSICLKCPNGTFSTSVGTTYCNLCDLGMYNDLEGQSECKPCSSGYFASSPGLAECSPCPRGFFGINEQTINCEACEPGTYLDEEGQALCHSCLPGTHAEDYGSSICMSCEKGYATSHYNQKYCNPCSAGSYANDTGKFDCELCPTGTYGPDIGLIECLPCPKGTRSILLGQIGCQQCPAGTTSLGGEADCEDCTPGFAQPLPGQTQCVPCPNGTYGIEYGLLDCIECPLGKYSPGENYTSCLPCPPGSKAPGLGYDECELCPPGEYQDQPGQSSCISCDLGSATTYDQYGATECTTCSPGTYENVDLHQCVNCTAGTFQRYAGAFFCDRCNPGYYSDEGATECTLCPLATYQELYQQSQCLPCPIGRYSNTLGNTRCSLCDPGYYQDEEGQTSCKGCEVGTYSPFSGANSSCPLCPLGTYKKWIGGDDCALSPNGTYIDYLGAVDPTPCPLGQYQPDVGQTSCLDCFPGTFAPSQRSIICSKCPLGHHQLLFGQSSCDECEPGTYSGQLGSVNCTECAPGLFTSLYGRSQCEPCPGGFWSDLYGSDICFQCRNGTRSTDISGSLSCTPCEAGTSSPVASVDCTPCLGETVAPYPGMVECVSCDPRSEANAIGTECRCNSGYVALNDQPPSELCHKCDYCLHCTKAGITETNVLVRPGYWRDDTIPNNTLNCHRCPNQKACLGLTEGCAIHHIGPLCLTCEDGYLMSSNIQCLSCPSNRTSYFLFSLVLIVIIVALVIQFYLVLRAGYQLLEKAKMREIRKWHEQEFQYYGINKQQDDTARIAALQLLEDGTLQAQPGFIYKFKILVGFLQIITSISFSLEVVWPEYYREFVGWFTIVNLDFIKIASIECLIETDFYRRYILVMCTPLIIIFGVVLFYLIPKYLRIYYFKKAEPDWKAAEWLTTKRAFWKMIIFILFLIYPLTARVNMTMFVCKNVDGVHYLVSDFRQQCYTLKWMSWTGVAGALVLIYPVGIPLLFFVMLFRNRKRHHEEGVRAQLGFLYAAYHPDAWWFEMADMTHKLFLTSCIILFPKEHGYQMLVGMIVCTFYLCVILYLKPYVRKGDDRLHLLVQVEIYMLLLIGYVFEEQIEVDELTNIALSIILIGLTIFLLMFFSIQVYMNVKQIYRNWVEKRKQAKIDMDSVETDGSFEMHHLRKDLAKEFSEVALASNPLFDQKAKLKVKSPEGQVDGDVIVNPIFGKDAKVTEVMSGVPALLERMREMEKINENKTKASTEPVIQKPRAHLPPLVPVSYRRDQFGKLAFKRILEPPSIDRKR